MVVEKIYFDMDGVLADFDRGVRELCGLEQSGQFRAHTSADDLMWERIRAVEHFYDVLKPMEGAQKLFGEVYSRYGENCEILTGIPKPKRGIQTAGEDKISWVRRELGGNVKVHIVYKEQKPEYCTGKGSILIDDFPENIRAWEEAGGCGVLYENAESAMTRLKEMGIL